VLPLIANDLPTPINEWQNEWQNVPNEWQTVEYDEWQIEDEQDISGLSGWRIEQGTKGRLRWRWQLKDENGESITYVTSKGNTGYKRGSKYIPKRQHGRVNI
jgi:hypothetical protein